MRFPTGELCAAAEKGAGEKFSHVGKLLSPYKEILASAGVSYEHAARLACHLCFASITWPPAQRTAQRTIRHRPESRALVTSALLLAPAIPFFAVLCRCSHRKT